MTNLIHMPVSGIIGIPASLRSDFIHIAGMPIHIPLESTIHITGIGTTPRELIRQEGKWVILRVLQELVCLTHVGYYDAIALAPES